ncbi:MAG: branched-chain amino acid ABC transporter permease [Alphaproteobacteria bacterium]
MENYLISIVTFGAFYALLALGLNLIWGMTGMINLGLAGFFAFGAYASALVTTAGGMPILLGLIVAVAAAGAAGALLTLITMRLRGDYLAIVTLGFSEVIRLIAANEIWLTNGTDGISGIPGPLKGSLDPAGFNLLFAGIALAVVVAMVFLAQRLRHSPYGRVLRAIRDDDLVAAVAGKRVRRFKVQAFALGAGLMGLAGALYGHYTSYIAPDIFRPLITIYIFLALTAGGTGNNVGAVLGGFLVMAVLEATRFIAEIAPDLPGAQLAALREILVGTILIVVMRIRPQGLIPERIATRSDRP